MPENQTPKKPLNTPLAPEVMHRLGQITNSRLMLGEKLIDFELEKVQLLVAARHLDEEKKKLFASELADRGLPPNTPVEVDGQTGVITVLTPED